MEYFNNNQKRRQKITIFNNSNDGYTLMALTQKMTQRGESLRGRHDRSNLLLIASQYRLLRFARNDGYSNALRSTFWLIHSVYLVINRTIKSFSNSTS